MKLRFIADENIPFRVIISLCNPGYDILSAKDVAPIGVWNNEHAEVSIRLDRIIKKSPYGLLN